MQSKSPASCRAFALGGDSTNPSAMIRRLRRHTAVTASTSRLELSARIATALLLLAGVAMFARGWLHSDMGAKIPWEPGGARQALLFSAGYWVVFLAIAAGSRHALSLKLVGAFAIALALAAGIVPLAAVALLFASSCALGYGILSRNGRAALGGPDLPLCTATGLGILGTTFSVMALWPINTQATWLVVLAIPLAWQGRAVFALVAGALQQDGRELRLRDLALVGLLGNLAAILTALALLPEVGNDALAIHLLIAAHVRDFGYWHYDVQRNVLAVMPLSVDFLYAAGYMFGGEVAARLINVGTLFVTLALVFTSVRAVAARRGALFATLLAVATPLAALESATLFIDNAWALFVVASLVAFLQFARDGDTVRLVVGGVGFGAALAAKSIAIAALPVVLALLAIGWRDHGARFPWRALGVAIVAGLAVALPPYLIALARTGNPVFPLFNAVFRSPLFPAVNGVAYPGSLDPLLLYRMTFYSDRYLEGLPGSLGFTFLLLGPAMLPAALQWGRREGRVLLFGLVTFAAIVVANTAYLRYLYPCVFLLAIAFGATLATVESRYGLLANALKIAGLCAVAANALFLPAGYAPIRWFDLAAVVDGKAREAHVATWAAARHFVPLLNALPASHGAVAFLGAPPFLAEVRRTAYVDSNYMRPFLGKTAALASETELRRLIREFDLGLLLVGARPGVPRPPASLASPLMSKGGLILYAVAPDARFPVERIAGPRFEDRAKAWTRHGAALVEEAGGAVVVSASNVLYQSVAVTGGAKYRYTVEARCHGSRAPLRMQVIWHLRGGGTSAHARSLPCAADWTEESDVITAPPDAELAIVYATGHSADPVEIRRVSLRSRE